jgi:hypothetical protein
MNIGGLIFSYLSDQIKSADICQLVEYYHVSGEDEELLPLNREMLNMCVLKVKNSNYIYGVLLSALQTLINGSIIKLVNSELFLFLTS